EERLKQPREPDRGPHADREPKSRWQQNGPIDEPRDVPEFRTQGHPDADLMTSLSGEVRRYAKNADRGKQEREARENSQKPHAAPGAVSEIGRALLEGLRIVQRNG